jgi:hypothetical protein
MVWRFEALCVLGVLGGMLPQQATLSPDGGPILLDLGLNCW